MWKDLVEMTLWNFKVVLWKNPQCQVSHYVLTHSYIVNISFVDTTNSLGLCHTK